VELLEQVVDDAAMSPSARPDVYTTLGRSYIALGQADRAVALWQRCLDEITDDAPEDLAAQVRFATYLSYALTDAGDLARAQTVLRDALRRSADLDDPYTRVRLYWSLGRLSGAEDHPLEALGYFRRAVALLEATEDTLHLARAHLSCAVWVLNSNGDLDEAGSHLEIAERLFGSGAEASDRIMLRTEQAKLRVRLGNPGEAAELAREGLALAGESLPDERGRTWLVLAQAYALEGTSSAAEEAFGTATKLLEEHGTPQDRSELSRTWAKWLRSVGRDSEALDVLERAADSAAAER
jgi:tetratricopeptide (TPR) repeat protein